MARIERAAARVRAVSKRTTAIAPSAKRLVFIGLALIAALLVAVVIWRSRSGEEVPAKLENALLLRTLPPNRWVKYHEERPGTWTRQAHAGMAFDTKRGTLLIFGSDTHGQDWDNAVHEFHPARKRWETHQPASGAGTYRVDASGTPIAGTDALQPWAMHTYDAIEYHPGLDALVVMSTTEHNPGPGPMPGIKQQPTWIYDLTKRQWRKLENGGTPAPTFFAGAATFDERRGVLVAYRNGIWEMDTSSGVWRKATSESHHELHYTMAYDRRRAELLVFGDYRPSNQVWSYRPGAAVGEKGTWTQRRPQGNPCPPSSALPVAYDAAQDVFVLVINDVATGAAAQPKAVSASTYLYDPERDVCTKLPGGELPALGMNYMMAWDRGHEVVFLVTGDWRGAVTIWAMKLRKQSDSR